MKIYYRLDDNNSIYMNKPRKFFSLRTPSYYALLFQVICNWRQLYYYNNYYKPSTVQDSLSLIYRTRLTKKLQNRQKCLPYKYYKIPSHM